MKITDIEKLNDEGKLHVSKELYRVRERFAKFPSKERVKYNVFMYKARTSDMKENEFYKITKKDFLRLSK